LKSLKFGYQQPSHSFAVKNLFNELRKIAVQCEDLGYDSFWIMDHLTQIAFVGEISDPILEPYTAISGIATSTNRIRLGVLCTCNFFRNPALLAKMGTGIDHISNGRFNLGLGAGWFQKEATMYGYRFPKARERLGMLEESVQIIKKAWTQGRVTFHGKYYEVKDLVSEPKPIQKPHPPILIGGGGEKITLRVVAKYANACNLFEKGEALRRKLGILKKHCKAEGRRYDSILKTKLATVFFGKDPKDALERSLAFKPRWMTVEDFAESAMLGSVKDIEKDIEQLKDMGVDDLIVNFRGKYNPQANKRFAEITRSF
jgi:F420-dependent oxidoreductase-like protein